MAQPKRRSNSLLTRAAAFAPSSFDATKRTVGLIWSTGSPVQRFDFEGPFTERLSMDPDAVDLSQLRGAPVLNSHNRFDVREILGTVQDPSVDGASGVATVRFSSRPDVEPVMRDVGDGIISRVSVGYSVQRFDTTKDAAGNRTKTATRWTPAEISFTAIGADPGARVRADGADDPDCECPPGTDPADCQCDENEEETMSAIPDQIRAAATVLGLTGPFVETLATRSDVTIETARGELLAHLQQSGPRIDGRAAIVRDEHDGFIDRALNALAHRIDHRIELRPDAQPWVGRRMADIGREILRMNGVSTLGGDNEIFMRWGALHSTSDFANFLEQLFNKQLLPRFLMAPSGLKEVTRRSTANDFRKKNVYRNSPMGQLMPLNEHGEFQRTTKADVKPESYAVDSFAAVFGISRQTLVNDDMGVFSDIGASLAQQSAEFENQQLATLLVSNPAMSDGNALFSAPHGNLAATGGAISEATLTAARLAMRLQVNQNGQPINVRPAFLLAPATQETVAQQALAEIYPIQTNAVNVFEDFVRLVIDPRLDLAGQTLSWYLFADTGTTPVLEDSYLSGYEGPRVFTRVGFQGGSNLDGTEVLCQLDYGVGVIGSQGAYMNPGA
jgi:phage major head subunit gpT-like protein